MHTTLVNIVICSMEIHHAVVVRDIETVRKLLLQKHDQTARAFLLLCQIQVYCVLGIVLSIKYNINYIWL